MTSQTLKQWLDAHPIREGMVWREAATDQIHFVVGTLSIVLRVDEPSVIGTHRSKSIELPVYHFARPDLGVDFYLRDNFHDWKLSVVSAKAIDVDIADLCHTTPPIDPDYTGDPIRPCYFEGFPPELVFGYYEQNRARWSALFFGRARLIPALHLIRRALGDTKKLTWSTRKE